MVYVEPTTMIFTTNTKVIEIPAPVKVVPDDDILA